MATHSNTLAWKIPWMEEPGGLLSMGSQRVGHDWATSLHFSYLNIFLMASLKPLCVNSDIWSLSQAVSIACFSPCVWVILSCLLNASEFLLDILDNTLLTTLGNACYCYSFICFLVTAWIISGIYLFHHPLEHETSYLASQNLQPWACPQSFWKISGFCRPYYLFPDHQ